MGVFSLVLHSKLVFWCDFSSLCRKQAGFPTPHISLHISSTYQCTHQLHISVYTSALWRSYSLLGDYRFLVIGLFCAFLTNFIGFETRITVLGIYSLLAICMLQVFDSVFLCLFFIFCLFFFFLFLLLRIENFFSFLTGFFFSFLRPDSTPPSPRYDPSLYPSLYRLSKQAKLSEIIIVKSIECLSFMLLRS